LTLNPSLSSII